MDNAIKFNIDGKECIAHAGQKLIDAAIENGVYIPYLCHMKDVIPAGSCRICQVKINGRTMTACTTPVSNDLDGRDIEMNTPELNEIRKAIVELLFVEGNHYCPACEKSGNCALQALAYKYNMMVPRFQYEFAKKEVFADCDKIMIDRNRCILCKRCIRTVKDESGKNIFAFKKRGVKLEINVDLVLGNKLSDEKALMAMNNCPVGAIIKKENGFIVPIGKRKFDKTPIGLGNLI